MSDSVWQKSFSDPDAQQEMWRQIMSGGKHTDEKGKEAKARSKIAKKLRKDMAEPAKGGQVKVKIKAKVSPQVASKMMKGMKR